MDTGLVETLSFRWKTIIHPVLCSLSPFGELLLNHMGTTAAS